MSQEESTDLDKPVLVSLLSIADILSLRQYFSERIQSLNRTMSRDDVSPEAKNAAQENQNKFLDYVGQLEIALWGRCADVNIIL